MLDWYSAYVMIRARQAELVGAAELRRRLAEAGAGVPFTARGGATQAEPALPVG